MKQHRAEKTRSQHWNEIRERGGFRGLRFMLFAYRYGGRRLCSFFVCFIVGYFFFTSQTTRRSSRDFLRRVYAAGGLDREPTWRDGLRHSLAFGRSILDKFSSWMGDIQRSQCIWSNRQILLDHAARKEGILLISAHLGNIEVLRAAIDGVPDLKINALVLQNNAEHINRLLAKANPNVKSGQLSLRSFSMDTAMDIKDRVDAGEFAAVLADRFPAGTRNRTVRVPFLGSKASFPQGPFILASLLECPVYFLVCLKGSGSNYVTHMELLSDRIDLPRGKRDEVLRCEIEKYAKLLEKWALHAPYQWFNFYDFWGEDVADTQQTTE